MSEKPCVNCGETVSTTYCAHCGQKKNVRPITWKGLMAEVSSTWLGMDNRFARTFVDLWVHPSKVIDAYLDGVRVRYIGPLSYLIIMSAMYILSFDVFGVDVKEMLTKSSQAFQSQQVDQNQQKFMEEYLQTISANMRLMVASLIPFMALSMIIVYEKRNYLQYFLTLAYMTAQMLWISILMNLVAAVTGYFAQIEGTVVNLTYFVWVFGTMNQRSTRWRTYSRALLAWILGYAFFMVALIIISIVAVIVMVTAGK